MAYGYETYKTDGSLLFSSADSTWNMIYTATASANTSPSFYPIKNAGFVTSRVVLRVMINQVTGDDEAYVHTYSLSGGSSSYDTLTVTAPSSTDTVETFFTIFGK